MTINIPNATSNRVRELRKQLAAIAASLGYVKHSRVGNPIPQTGSIGLMLLAIAQGQLQLERNTTVNIDFGQYMYVGDKVRLYNCTPHPIKFQHKEAEIILSPCGATLSARPIEGDVLNHPFEGIKLVTTTFVGSPEGYQELEAFGKLGVKVLLVGSVISAQAYRFTDGHPVVGMVIADTSLSRLPPDQRVYSSVCFNVY